MPYEGDDTRDQLLSRLGFGEGWADCFEVFTLIIPSESKSWLADIIQSETLCIYEQNKETGSKVWQIVRKITEPF